MFSKLTTAINAFGSHTLKTSGRASATLAAFWLLLRYDVLFGIYGFKGVYSDVMRVRVSPRELRPQCEEEVMAAFQLAASLYYKHVRCLQRSAVLVRLLRQSGLPATLVIGYRAMPFLGHAWVELGGAVWNDSPEYQRRLHTLDRLEAL